MRSGDGPDRPEPARSDAEASSAMNEEQSAQARAMIDDPKLKIKSILKTLEISKATLYKYVPTGKFANENEK